MKKILRNWGWDIHYNVFTGDVYGNPEFEEGYPIHTSSIRKITFIKETQEYAVHTLNSMYYCKKGDHSKEFEEKMKADKLTGITDINSLLETLMCITFKYTEEDQEIQQ